MRHRLQDSRALMRAHNVIRIEITRDNLVEKRLSHDEHTRSRLVKSSHKGLRSLLLRPNQISVLDDLVAHILHKQEDKREVSALIGVGNPVEKTLVMNILHHVAERNRSH